MGSFPTIRAFLMVCAAPLYCSYLTIMSSTLIAILATGGLFGLFVAYARFGAYLQRQYDASVSLIYFFLLIY